MGFYAPAQLIRDAREHGVEIRPVDVNRSRWDHFLEPALRGPHLALRLGFRLVAGLREAEIARLVDRRDAGYASPEELQRRAGLARATLVALAEADAFGSLGLDRRAALWRVSGLAEDPPPPLADAPAFEPPAALPPTPPGRDVAEDYAALGLTLKRHPISFLRPMLDRRGIAAASTLAARDGGERVTVAGLVLFRQRPGTAKDTIFVTLEDETGSVILIVWRSVWERHRRAVFGAKLIVCAGALQIEDGVLHVIADRLDDATAWLRHLRDDPQFALRRGNGDARKHAGAPDPRLRASRPPLPDEVADEVAAMRLRSRDFR
jgi:error-prone DNA polymerase